MAKMNSSARRQVGHIWSFILLFPLSVRSPCFPVLLLSLRTHYSFDPNVPFAC